VGKGGNENFTFSHFPTANKPTYTIVRKTHTEEKLPNLGYF